jgi:hypothetical protein
MAGFVAPIVGTKLSDKIGYVLLDLAGRSVFEFLAFCSVTELWLETALQASPTNFTRQYLHGSLLIRTLNRVLGAVSVLMSTILAIYLLFMNTMDSLEQIEKTELLFRLQILMEALSWAAGAAFVFVCAQITKERIQMSLETFPPADYIERLSLQSQALAPMITCAFCYAVRSIFLLCRLTGETAIFIATTRFQPIWWVAFVWAPTWLVVASSLYAARRRDRSILLDASGDPLDPDNSIPLLGQLGQPSIPPPAAAFRNFRLFSEGITTPSHSVGPSSPTKESSTAGRPPRPPPSPSPPQQRFSSLDLACTGHLGDFTEV